MSIGGGASSGANNQVTQLDPQIKGDWQQLYGQAQATAAEPAPQQQVAPLNAAQDVGLGNTLSGAFNGAGALQSGVTTAENAANFNAPQIQQTYDGQSIDATTDPYTAANMATNVGGQSIFGNASHYSGAQIPASVDGQSIFQGGVNGYGAAQSAAPDGSVIQYGYVGAPQQGDLSPYLNPYTSDVYDTSLNQLDLARQQAINDNSSAATLQGGEGAFNGSRAGVSDALTNQNFATQAANLASTLNNQNFSQAQAAAQNYAQLGEQAQQSNQSADLQNGITQYGGLLSTDLANLGAQNTAAQFNAAAGNSALQFDAGQALNAGAANQASTNQANQFDATADNNMSQFNAGQAYNSAAANQAAANQAAQFNSNAFNQASIFNGGQTLSEQQANAANAIASEQAQLQAAGLLGNLGTAEQAFSLTGANAQTGAGTTVQQQQQSQDNAAYQNAMTARNLPLQTEESAFGIIPSTNSGSVTNSNSSGKSGQAGI